MFDTVQAFVKGIYIFPLGRTMAPKGYIDKKIPKSNPREKENYYNFIKPIWTKNKALAATMFQVGHTYNKSDKERLSKDNVVVFCDENSIITTYNEKDTSKAEVIDVVNKRKRSTDGKFWSCTGSLASGDNNSNCGGEEVFLCWKWRIFINVNK